MHILLLAGLVIGGLVLVVAGMANLSQQILDSQIPPRSRKSLQGSGMTRKSRSHESETDSKPAQTKPSVPQKDIEPNAPKDEAGQNESPQVPDAAWQSLMKEMDKAVSVIGSYEIDPALAIAYPAFNDVTVPQTSAMAKALKKAVRLRNSLSWEDRTRNLFDTFGESVDDLVTKLSAAERTARKMRWSKMSHGERKSLAQAQNLLTQASDPGNTKEARATFSAQLARVVRRLNEQHGVAIVPVKAMASIEQKTRLSIAD